MGSFNRTLARVGSQSVLADYALLHSRSVHAPYANTTEAGMSTKAESELIDPDERRRVEQLIDERVAANVNALQDERLTFGQQAADRLADYAGSWAFIIGFLLFLGIWIAINAIAIAARWDPYPFILLNLLLSCLAAIQAPIIMMSQNRQEARDRLRAENDYQVNLKAEILLEYLAEQMAELKAMQARKN